MSNSRSKPEIVGMGAPILDYIVEVSEQFLEKIPGAKAGMVPVDYEMLKKIISDVGVEPLTFLGGSAANTIRGLASLGHHCAFIGKIGNDSAGKKIVQGMSQLGISTKFLLTSSKPTAQVVCLITPDKERTMRSFLGANQEMSAQDLTHEMFSNAKLVHFEGYTLLNLPLMQKGMEIAKEEGAKISFDMGSFELVAKHKDTIINIVSQYVDVIFANREEIQVLSGLNPEKGCAELQDIFETVVVLLGKEGCIVGSGLERFHHPGYPVHLPVDTTGAGDLFASGFLHGYLQGKMLEECANYGSLAGSAVVKVRGVELPSQIWNDISNSR